MSNRRLCQFSDPQPPTQEAAYEDFLHPEEMLLLASDDEYSTWVDERHQEVVDTQEEW